MHGSALAALWLAPVAASSVNGMCRSIHTLHNFEPAATDDEVHAAALQFVRKISGTNQALPGPTPTRSTGPSRRSPTSPDTSLEDLVTAAPPKSREVEAAKAKARSAQRFATS